MFVKSTSFMALHTKTSQKVGAPDTTFAPITSTTQSSVGVGKVYLFMFQ